MIKNENCNQFIKLIRRKAPHMLSMKLMVAHFHMENAVLFVLYICNVAYGNDIKCSRKSFILMKNCWYHINIDLLEEHVNILMHFITVLEFMFFYSGILFFLVLKITVLWKCNNPIS